MEGGKKKLVSSLLCEWRMVCWGGAVNNEFYHSDKNILVSSVGLRKCVSTYCLDRQIFGVLSKVTDEADVD